MDAASGSWHPEIRGTGLLQVGLQQGRPSLIIDLYALCNPRPDREKYQSAGGLRLLVYPDSGPPISLEWLESAGAAPAGCDHWLLLHLQSPSCRGAT
jgi:hypothetical protein